MHQPVYRISSNLLNHKQPSMKNCTVYRRFKKQITQVVNMRIARYSVRIDYWIRNGDRTIYVTRDREAEGNKVEKEESCESTTVENFE